MVKGDKFDSALISIIFVLDLCWDKISYFEIIYFFFNCPTIFLGIEFSLQKLPNYLWISTVENNVTFLSLVLCSSHNRILENFKVLPYSIHWKLLLSRNILWLNWSSFIFHHWSFSIWYCSRNIILWIFSTKLNWPERPKLLNFWEISSFLLSTFVPNLLPLILIHFF